MWYLWENCRKLKVNFFFGLNFLASSACFDNEKKIWCFVFKDLLNGYRRLSRKPIAFKADFFKHATLAQADINWHFFAFSFFFPLQSAIHAGVFLYDNFERQQCGTKTLIFSTDTMNELACFLVSWSVCQVHFNTQWQTKYVFFHFKNTVLSVSRVDYCTFQSWKSLSDYMTLFT